MSYTITSNPAFGSLEVVFTDKPSAAVRDALKALRFRWHSVKKCWYGYATEEQARAAIDGQTASKDESKKPAKVDKELLRREYSLVWDNEKMISHCLNKAAAVAELPGGEMIVVEKQGIETRFCFGESGYDYEEAQSEAAHARTSKDYFKRENMERFNRIISDIRAQLDGTGRKMLVLYPRHYIGQPNECRLASFGFAWDHDVVEAAGGSCFLDQMGGQELTIRGTFCRVMTDEEIKAVLSAYEQAAADHEKKVDAYLKRYGTSKVRAWTYWRDA